MVNKKNILNLEIISNEEIFDDHYIMTFFCDLFDATIIKPGNFLNIYLNDAKHLLPRPFCVFDYSKNKLKIFYRVKGCGTKILSLKKAKDHLKVLIPLGNNFPLEVDQPVSLLAGGMGIAPIHFFLKYLEREKPKVINKINLFYGALNKEMLFFHNYFENLGVNLYLSTDDGSFGFNGNCLDYFKNEITKGMKVSKVLACGPHKMLVFVSGFCINSKIETYVSLEANMGCGFGACVGCVQKVRAVADQIPYKLVCSDGPVFNAKEIDWSE